jgi:phosphopantothenoylcysteine decarboxylase/phosphopantothenate--cysteine ligase
MIGEHPSRDIIGSISGDLAGRRIVLCITGSVAAVRAAEIARLLMRHGAEVFAVMSAASRQIIHPDLMHWATGNPTVTEIGGGIEHVALAGNVRGRADLVLVAPATANTIGKIAAGIDDTPVTTTVTTALGQGIPLIIVPAMHEPMYRHPFVAENIARLRQSGITLLMPRLEEGKAKIADNHEILAAVRSCLAAERPLAGKKLLITSGRTVEYLDPIRVITNNSSGKMGAALAAAALAAGAEVTVISGKAAVPLPAAARVLSVETAAEMQAAVQQELKTQRYDALIAAAAVGDWRARKRAERKVSTHTRSMLNLELEPTPKIIDQVKETAPGIFLVAFRAQAGLSREELIADAHARLRKAGADLIAVNDVSRSGAGFETDTNELFLVDGQKNVEHIELTSKDAAAGRIIARVAERLGS